jgi:hypothetical protein
MFCSFREAARCFCGISKVALASLTDICSMSGLSTQNPASSSSEVLAFLDVATLGAVCGLASFDRKEVKAKLLEHSEFTEVMSCSMFSLI